MVCFCTLAWFKREIDLFACALMVLDVVQKLRGFYDNSPNGKGRGRKGRKSAGGAIVEEESQDVGNEDEAKKGKEKGFRVVLQNDKSLKEDKVSLVLRVRVLQHSFTALSHNPTKQPAPLIAQPFLIRFALHPAPSPSLNVVQVKTAQEEKQLKEEKEAKEREEQRRLKAEEDAKKKEQEEKSAEIERAKQKREEDRLRKKRKQAAQEQEQVEKAAERERRQQVVRDRMMRVG